MDPAESVYMFKLFNKNILIESEMESIGVRKMAPCPFPKSIH